MNLVSLNLASFSQKEKKNNSCGAFARKYVRRN